MTTSIVRCCRSAAGTSFVVLAFVCVAQTAAAQTQPASDMGWQRGTTLFGFGGAQSASSHVSAAAGLGLGWEVTRRFAVEGRAIWFNVGEEATDFAATMAAHVPLTRGRMSVPFLTGGVGMYRATVDSRSSAVLDFYRNRLSDGFVGRQTFQDFQVTFGGGVDMRLTNHFFLRPEANMMVVTTQADHRQVGVYGVQLVYHFESHPVE